MISLLDFLPNSLWLAKKMPKSVILTTKWSYARSLFILSLFFSFLWGEENKIALLFLTVNEVNHPRVWQEALGPHREHFSLYVHSKNPISDPLFAPHRIREIVPTTWNKHMKAWKALLREALLDERNKKFIFLSESCLPLKPLGEIYQSLLSHDKSCISYGPASWFAGTRILNELPEAFRFANQEWIILNRRHARYLVEDDLVIELVIRHDSDIENYPSVYLNLMGELNDEFVINHMTTFVDWQHQNAGNCSPYHFYKADPLSLQILDKAKQSGAFFCRKFTKTFPEDVLFDLIRR